MKVFLSRLFVAMCISLLSMMESRAQQCTLPSRIFLPTADQAEYELFGSSLDVDGNYMVAGMSENSSQQVSSGRAIVYKLGNDNQWIEIAELTPSDPAKYLNFGSQVAVHGNSIVVVGRQYNDDGISREKLYVFEKAPGGEWASSTESYVIAKPFGTYLDVRRFDKLTLHGNELVVLAYSQKAFIEVYTKSGGVFSLTQSIEMPLEMYNQINDRWDMEVGADIIAIGTEQFDNPDGSAGAVFIYEKTLGSYAITPKVLKNDNQDGNY